MSERIRNIKALHNRPRRTISKAVIDRMNIRKKAECPCCGKNLLNLYGSVCVGCATVSCIHCGKISAIDLKTGEAACVTCGNT